MKTNASFKKYVICVIQTDRCIWKYMSSTILCETVDTDLRISKVLTLT